MSDTGVTPADPPTGTEHHKMRIPGSGASNHTRAPEILAQGGSQRAARAPACRPAPDPQPTHPRHLRDAHRATRTVQNPQGERPMAARTRTGAPPAPGLPEELL